MRFGALNNLVALLLIVLVGNHATAALRLSTQVQFIHGMATLACATFMNIGGRDAAKAPAFFLGGVLLYCLPTYVEALGFPAAILWVKPFGLGALAIGWLILAWSAREIDRI
jgi:uncharacterized membrane protein YgdD (TMEM256/DUF423 family)